MKLNRLSLNVVGLNRIGLNQIGSPSRGSSSGTDRPYIDPEVLASLKAVCICYGKSNDDPDRAVVKNLVDPDNPFVISNAAFKLNSGFGEYKEDFTTWSKVAGTSIITDSKYVLTDEKAITNAGYFLWNRLAKDSFKVKISNIPNGGWMSYRYRITKEDTQFSSLFIREDGIYTLPATVAGSDVDFFISTASAPAKDWVGLTITQIPSFEGAFFTDGVEDLITSTKTVQEMGITDEVTVVSMIHQIDKPSNFITTNNIRTSGSVVGRNAISLTDKTGIYGWYKDNIQGSTINVINNILGDKADYTASASSNTNLSSKFSVVGYISNDSIVETSQVAWYWTIIANKVLTTDQINQVIAYFNLDRTLKPDILCDVKKQGITNDNHAEFGDKLIDFSGNGRDIQLNNIAWDGDSGIGKYNYPNWKVTATIANTYSTIVNYPTVNGTYSINVNGVSELMQSIGLHLEIRYTTSAGFIFNDIKQDGVYSYILPDGATDLTLRFGGIPGIVNEPCNITITQIPSHAGGLCLDGINDFGKVTGMPIYKDYTVIADYERFYLEPITGGRASILSKSSKVGDGSFIFNLEDQDGGKACYTFGGANGNISDDITRIIRYQSKYYNTKTLSIGTAEDNDFMVLGKVREVDSRHFCGAIYSLMSFPYSMSEFLIERQLKKHKLGTLYPDMVEFRPIVKSNLPYSSISYSVNPGEYISVDSMVTITVTLPNTSDKLMEVSCNAISDISISGDNGVYEITGKVVKSPQKINLVISSYLTMLSNSTLISNETLIKNE